MPGAATGVSHHNSSTALFKRVDPGGWHQMVFYSSVVQMPTAFLWSPVINCIISLKSWTYPSVLLADPVLEPSFPVSDITNLILDCTFLIISFHLADYLPLLWFLQHSKPRKPKYTHHRQRLPLSPHCQPSNTSTCRESATRPQPTPVHRLLPPTGVSK